MNTFQTYHFTDSVIVDITPKDSQETASTPLLDGTCLLHLDGVPILTKLEEPELYKIGDTSPNGMVLRKNAFTGYSCILTREQWEYIRDRKGETEDYTLQDILDGIPIRESIEKHAHTISVKELAETLAIRKVKYAIAALIRDKPILVTAERLARVVDTCPFLDPTGAEYTELVDSGMKLAQIFGIVSVEELSGATGSNPEVSTDTLTDKDVAMEYLRTEMKKSATPDSKATHMYEHLLEILGELSTVDALECIGDTLAVLTGTPVVSIFIGKEVDTSGIRPLTVKYADAEQDTPKAIELSEEDLAYRKTALASLAEAVDTYNLIGEEINTSYQKLIQGDTLPEGVFHSKLARLYAIMVGMDIEEFVKRKAAGTLD